MIFKVQFEDPTPPYLQIVEQVIHSAASGRMAPGDALPSIRKLAESLKVNRNTVDKAFRELEHRGVVEIQRGKGAFIRNGGSPMAESYRLDELRSLVDQVAVRAHHLRIEDQQVIDLMKERLDSLRRERQEAGSSNSNISDIQA